MSAAHINDELLDGYASGLLQPEFLASVEEHLLQCEDCQKRLVAVDEFVGLFRATATQPDARPTRLTRTLFSFRVLVWTGAAVLAAATLFLISPEFRRPPMAPASVLLHSLRGPEAAVSISAGKPARLVFDFTTAAPARDYEVQIVNVLGTHVLTTAAEFHDGHLSVPIQKLEAGSYWVRIYDKADGELVAEYGLRSE